MIYRDFKVAYRVGRELKCTYPRGGAVRALPAYTECLLYSICDPWCLEKDFSFEGQWFGPRPNRHPA